MRLTGIFRPNRVGATLMAALIAGTVGLAVPMTALAAPDLNYGQSYVSYTYNFEGEPVATPAAYEAVRTLSGYDYGTKPFSDLADITYDGDRLIYLTDSGNNRILVLNQDYSLKKEIDSYIWKDQKTAFSAPTCTAVVNGLVYIADSMNARIVVLDTKTGQTVRVLEQPKIPALGDYTYIPTKVAVDYAGRIYVIAKNINKGLIQLNAAGEFENFLGAPKVTPKFSEVLMRKFFSKTMRAQLIKSVPTEYNAVNIDADGFLFVTSQSTNIPPIARLNGQGTNVLKSVYDDPKGDGNYKDENGKTVDSMFVDVIPRSDGGYFGLDATRGRIFSYDRQGMLLYVFGSSGTSRGSFYSASSMEYIAGQVVVTDKSTGLVTVFARTEFSTAVDQAVKLSALGKLRQEETAWKNVLRLCSNYDTAQINLAKIEINDEKYTQAMGRLSQINEKKNYGVAYGYARNAWTKSHFYWLAAALVLVIGLAVLWRKILRKTKPVTRFIGSAWFCEVRYGLYVMCHPFDGFWDLKREKRGSMRGALTILVLFTVFYGIRARFTGYPFMTEPYRQVNVALSVATILIPVLLWVVSNWCFTTLMDGKGTMKDTFIAVCYALTPYVLLSPLQLALSWLLVNEEMAFYTYLDAIVLVWVLGLFFFGMMMTHDYSFSKSLLTAILTIVGICLILFLCLLCFNLFHEIYSYFYDLYQEISFRFY